MEWKDVGKSLLGIAPTLATVLGGPAGIVAGGAIKVLTGLLGLGEDAPAASVSAELAKLNPAEYVRLREIDDAFKKSLLDAGVKLEDIAMQDRKSARDMQVATRSWTPDILAFVLTIGFFGMLWLMYSKAPAPESKDLLNIMLGSLGTAWVTAMAFYFGSSSGSDKLKDILGAAK